MRTFSNDSARLTDAALAMSQNEPGRRRHSLCPSRHAAWIANLFVWSVAMLSVSSVGGRKLVGDAAREQEQPS